MVVSKTPHHTRGLDLVRSLDLNKVEALRANKDDEELEMVIVNHLLGH